MPSPKAAKAAEELREETAAGSGAGATPKKAPAAKKTATKKTAVKKTAAKKGTAKKSTPAKKPAKKAAAKKTAEDTVEGLPEENREDRGTKKTATKQKTGAKKTPTPKKTAAKKAPAASPEDAKARKADAPKKKTAAKASAGKKKAASYKLVIVESPTKARTISKFLGKGYHVEASQGHLRDLPKSQIGVDTDADFEPKYITIRGKGEILSKIRKEAAGASQIFLATDPDREGEAISWHLATLLELDPQKACRVEFHEITKSAVLDAMKHPKALNMQLVDAQQARRVLDRLVGYKISPLLWAKVKKGLSAGRVQSVVTRMVVLREEEIEAFIPEEYWDIRAKAQIDTGKPFQLSLSSLDGQKVTLKNAADAEKARARIEQGHFTVTSLKHGTKERKPSPPFTTSSLQQEAGRKLNFTTSRTMQVVQQLYEGVDIEGEGTQGLVTYIRTDSVRLSDEAIADIRSYIPEKYGKEYLPEHPVEYKVRNNAQNAHEAIRPTSIHRTPESIQASLTKEQFLLYRLIYNRTIASQMAPATYETMTAEISDAGVLLRFYGEHRTFAGYATLYEAGQDEQEESFETQLPKFIEGQDVQIVEITPQQHFTQPPSRYTEASLVRAMEEMGIGRPSTYAPTITTIISRGYVSREKRKLYPTELGRMVTHMMEDYFSEIVDTDFTANLESKLDSVEEGQENWKQILRTFYPDFSGMLSRAEEEVEKIQIQDEVSTIPCEKCGAMMVYKMGRYGKFLACPNFPECRFTKHIVNYIDVPCPKCGGRLMEKITKSNRKFYGCERYPECDFTSWEKPVSDRCPACGAYMVEKHGKHGELSHLCTNPECRKKLTIRTSTDDMQEAETDA